MNLPLATPTYILLAHCMNVLVFHYLHSSLEAQPRVHQASPGCKGEKLIPRTGSHIKKGKRKKNQIKHTSNTSKCTSSLESILVEGSKPAFVICSLKNLILRAISSHLFI